MANGHLLDLGSPNQGLVFMCDIYFLRTDGRTNKMI